MTLIAGAIARGPSTGLDPVLCQDLERTLSRHPDDVPEVFRHPRCVLVKVDAGVHCEPAVHTEPDGSVTIMAGDALLGDEESAAGVGRAAAVRRLHRDLAADRRETLSAARGVFSAAQFRASDGRLTVVADKLGLRPIYYWIGPDLVVFASALRVLTDLSVVPKRMDLRGIIETRTLGVPLGARTALADVSLLKTAEIMEVSGEAVTRSHYWRWDTIEESKAPMEELLSDAHARFGEAVDRRLGAQRRVASFLSGGLDSRVITAELRRRGATVHTFNFARPGTQDQLLGGLFAKAVGSVHHELPIVLRGANAKYAFTLAGALDEAPDDAEIAHLPRLVWSGDGGSIGVGHVRVDPDIVRLLRAGEQRAAVELFLDRQRARIPRRLFRPAVAGELEHATADGIHEELAEIQSPDRGRAFHLFLMLNDQRRHLADHFEHIDLHRLEYQLPFFDSRFMERILSVPLDLCLRHGFYSPWLARFPEVVRSVPWQTYPGHVPCPLPLPADLGYQWDQRVSTLVAADQRKRRRLAAAREALASRDFPSPILNRLHGRLAYWIYKFGLRDYGYALDYVTMLHRHWQRSGGRFVLEAKVPGLGRE